VILLRPAAWGRHRASTAAGARALRSIESDLPLPTTSTSASGSSNRTRTKSGILGGDAAEGQTL